MKTRTKRIRIPVILLLILTIVVIGASGCSSSKKTARGRHHPKVDVVLPSNISSDRKAIVREAETWVGTPYLYAGYDKKEGTDCSGMVLRVFDDVLGIKLPRNSAKQAEFCKKIKQNQVLPGDLVFFATGKDPDRISHVGIMISEEDFIHASTSKGVVVSKVSTPYYQRVFKMYGRPADLR